MFRKSLLLFVFLVSCFLSSCRATRQETQKVSTTSSSSITATNDIFKEYIEKYRDTTLFVPGSSTSLKLPLSEFKPNLNSVETKKFSQKNGSASIKGKIEKDTVYLEASCDSVQLRAKIKTELEREFQKSELNDKSQKDSKIETDTTKKTGNTFLDIVIAFLVGFIVSYILKSFKVL